MCKRSKIYIISGPSGVGKDTVIKKFSEVNTDVDIITTVTTRKIRKNEKDKIDYIFVNEKEFKKLIESNKLIEWSKVYGNYYGVPKNQIEKGISGTKKLLSFFKKKNSIALMIDQRVSQGIKSKFFNHECFATTIPAQFVKKFKCKVVPVYIERLQGVNFQLTIHETLEY